MKLSSLLMFEASTNKKTAAQKKDEMLDRFVSVIKRDCKPMLDLINRTGQLIYRGMYVDSYYANPHEYDEDEYDRYANDLYAYEVDQNRSPRDSSIEFHNAYNEMLSVYGNNPKWRSNSVFGTIKSSTAKHYSNGTPAVILPIGEFEVLYSPIIVDAYNFFEDVSNINGITKLLKSKLTKPETLQKVYDLIDSLDYRSFIGVALYMLAEQAIEDDSLLRTLPKKIQSFLESSAAIGFIRHVTILHMFAVINELYTNSLNNMFDLLYDILFGNYQPFKYNIKIDQLYGLTSSKEDRLISDKLSNLKHSYNIKRPSLAEFDKSKYEQVRRAHHDIIVMLGSDQYIYHKSSKSIDKLPASEIMIKCEKYYMVEPSHLRACLERLK